jgi:hypothetical protein
MDIKIANKKYTKPDIFSLAIFYTNFNKLILYNNISFRNII